MEHRKTVRMGERPADRKWVCRDIVATQIFNSSESGWCDRAFAAGAAGITCFGPMQVPYLTLLCLHPMPSLNLANLQTLTHLNAQHPISALLSTQSLHREIRRQFTFPQQYQSIAKPCWSKVSRPQTLLSPFYPRFPKLPHNSRACPFNRKHDWRPTLVLRKDGFCECD
jgi:hypothetical protein